MPGVRSIHAMPRVFPHVLVLVCACSSRPPPTTSTGKTAPSAACVVGQFVSSFEDDGHGVEVELSAARTSSTGYQPSSEQQFYVHDKGNPTRGLRPGDEVWLIQNDAAAAWPWSYLTADQAGVRCPARPAPP